MKFRIGEKVKFLNDVGGGTITSLIDNKTVLVTTRDGFEVPVMITELVSDSSEYFSEKSVKAEKPVNLPSFKKQERKEEREEAEIQNTGEEEEILFAVMPVGQTSELYAYLINNSSHHIHYVVSIEKESENLLFDQGVLEPGVKIRMNKFMPENINELVSFIIQLLFFKNDFFIKKDPVSIPLLIMPSDVYSGRALEDNEFFEQKAAILKVFNLTRKIKISIESPLKKVKNTESDKPTPPKSSDNNPFEVDLHIGKIMDDFSSLTPGEILEIQMARFKTSLETAIIHKIKRIVFIHGIGNGQLKFKVRKALDVNYPDLKYQDASFKEYGYGATMVIIK